MNKPSVSRSDISLNEDALFNPFRAEAPRVTWTATLSGELSTGESISMLRTGPSFKGALNNLEAAIRAEGWEIREERTARPLTEVWDD